MLKNKGQQIVDAAIRRFIYYGIAKTTMEDIAQDIALAKPSLYHYFDSKNHLVRAVFDHVLNEYLCLLNAIKLNQSLADFRRGDQNTAEIICRASAEP